MNSFEENVRRTVREHILQSFADHDSKTKIGNDFENVVAALKIIGYECHFNKFHEQFRCRLTRKVAPAISFSAIGATQELALKLTALKLFNIDLW